MTALRDQSGKKSSLVQKVYSFVKEAIFNFELLPGDFLVETELANLTGTSRTPVREALLTLQQEGYVVLKARAGWQVSPFDFKTFEELYDLRILLETNAIQSLCRADSLPGAVLRLGDFWLTDPALWVRNGSEVQEADEVFHETLVSSGGNREITKLHHDITERIRIIRRLDFGLADRVAATYREHGQILKTLLARQAEECCSLLESHILVSRTVVRTITFQQLETGRGLRYGS